MHGELKVVVAIASPNDSETINDFNSEIKLCRHLEKSVSIADFAKRIKELLRLTGIDAWSHTDIHIVIDVLDVFGIWPKELTARYAKEEFYRDDLVLRHMMISDQPLFAHHVFDFVKNAPFQCGLFKRNLEIQKLLYRYKMHNVFCIPIVTENVRSIFTVATKHADPASFEATIARHRRFLLMLGSVIGLVGRKKFTPHFHGERSKLSIPIQQKPLQLLDQLATKDLSLNEAAAVLGISISTANQHIASAKKAFGTNTTHGTVVAAILGGHIVLDI
jgi:DNA-binding CsgD family transcriptional regulator